MEEGSQTEPGIGTHPPFGITVVGITHKGLGLDFSVIFYSDDRRGEFEASKT